MKAGEFQEGEHVLRAKIDMASPNFNMRDPVIYRIRFAHHYRTGDKWCIYPMYDYTHCDRRTRSRTSRIRCARWSSRIIVRSTTGSSTQLADDGVFTRPLPQQIEFSRLNLTYAITSKRKLLQLVTGRSRRRLGRPAHADHRRRAAPRLHAGEHPLVRGSHRRDEGRFVDRHERAGRRAARRSRRQGAARDRGARSAEARSSTTIPKARARTCSAPVHPHHPERGTRAFPFSRELWIEREDFQEMPPKGYFRLFPGNKVRLKYGFVVECTGADKDENGNVTAVHCNYFPDSKSGTEGANSYKVKGTIHWVSAAARVRGRSAPLRPAVQGTAAGRGRRGFPRRAQSGFEARRATRTWNRAHAMRLPKTASSSSATAISSRIASIRSRASRCSTASSVCATVGASRPDMRPQGTSRGNERAARRARTIGFARASPTQRGA